MTILQTLKALIPQPHGFMDDNGVYHLGVTWEDSEELTDTHSLEVCYRRNCERLALTKGTCQPDGSWLYTEPSGMTHSISAGKANAFMAQAQAYAEMHQSMMDRIVTQQGYILDADASAA